MASGVPSLTSKKAWPHYVGGVLLVLLVLDFAAVLCDLFKLLSSMWQLLCTPKSDAVSRRVVHIYRRLLLPDHLVRTHPPLLLSSLHHLPSLSRLQTTHLCVPAVNRSLHNFLLLLTSMWVDISFPLNLKQGGAFVSCKIFTTTFVSFTHLMFPVYSYFQTFSV